MVAGFRSDEEDANCKKHFCCFGDDVMSETDEDDEWDCLELSGRDICWGSVVAFGISLIDVLKKLIVLSALKLQVANLHGRPKALCHKLLPAFEFDVFHLPSTH